MNKRGFAPLIVLVLIAILGSLGYFTYKSQHKLIAEPIVNEKDELQLSSPTSIPTAKPTGVLTKPSSSKTSTSKPTATTPAFKSVTVNSFAYEDRNNDGIFNSDDPALPYMQFYIYDSYDPKTQISTVYSDLKGNFSISLEVKNEMIIHPTASNNFVPKSGDIKFAASSNGSMFAFRSASAPVANQNVGIIEGNVFNDINRNLFRDSGENSTYFYKLYLKDSQGNYYNTIENAQTTDEGGHFKFINLPVPATYTILLSNPSGTYDILKAETVVSLTNTNTQNTNIEIPVYNN